MWHFTLTHIVSNIPIMLLSVLNATFLIGEYWVKDLHSLSSKISWLQNTICHFMLVHLQCYYQSFAQPLLDGKHQLRDLQSVSSKILWLQMVMWHISLVRIVRHNCIMLLWVLNAALLNSELQVRDLQSALSKILWFQLQYGILCYIIYNVTISSSRDPSLMVNIGYETCSTSSKILWLQIVIWHFKLMWILRNMSM